MDSKNSQAKERTLSFNKFLQQRSSELVKFANSIAIATKKGGHQGLPKSIRRRAMSHNRYRIPLQLRKKNQEELKNLQIMQRIPKCRKHIRKRYRLSHSYKQRHGRIRWMATHLWSAKRMAMVEKYGFKIPYKPNDKCFRSAYRHFRHNCCLMDYSYLRWIRIQNKHKKLPSNFILQKSEIQTINCFKWYNLYKQQLKQESFVCPVLVMKQSQQIFHGLFHPACIQQVRNIIWEDDYNVTIGQEFPLDIYYLLGPESLKYVLAVAQKLQYKIPQNLYPNLIVPGNLKQNQMQFLQRQKLQKKEKQPLITPPYNESLKQSYDCNNNKNIRLAMFAHINNILQHGQQSTKQKNKFWDYFNKQADLSKQIDIQFKVTTRSKYTHKRTNKISKSQKKSLIKTGQVHLKSLPKKQAVKKAVQKIQQISITESKQIIDKKQTDQNLMAIGAINSRQSFYQGCFVLCSKRNNCQIWRNLTHQHIKVIGLRQYRHFMLQAGQLCFPFDYPSAQAFKKQRQTMQLQNFCKIKRKPPQKRINYSKINSPFPFQIPRRINTCKLYKIQMVAKGRCFEGSYICQLQKADIIQLQKNLQEGTTGIITEQQNIQQNIFKLDYQKMNKQEIIEKLALIESQRKIIGFVTSGGFLFSQAKQGGIGFIDSQYNLEYALIRKPTSRFYFAAHLHKIDYDGIY